MEQKMEAAIFVERGRIVLDGWANEALADVREGRLVGAGAPAR